MVNEQILDYVKNLSPGDHAILLYESIEDKDQVLFNYIKAGLDRGEAAVYVTAQVSSEQVRKRLKVLESMLPNMSSQAPCIYSPIRAYT